MAHSVTILRKWVCPWFNICKDSQSDLPLKIAEMRVRAEAGGCEERRLEVVSRLREISTEWRGGQVRVW